MKKLLLIVMFLMTSCDKESTWKHEWIFSGKSKICTSIFKPNGERYSMEELLVIYPKCTTIYNAEHNATIMDCKKSHLKDEYVFFTSKEICEVFREKYFELKRQ